MTKAELEKKVCEFVAHNIDLNMSSFEDECKNAVNAAEISDLVKHAMNVSSFTSVMSTMKILVDAGLIQLEN